MGDRVIGDTVIDVTNLCVCACEVVLVLDSHVCLCACLNWCSGLHTPCIPERFEKHKQTTSNTFKNTKQYQLFA